MKISILIMNAFGMGGTVQASVHLADELSRRHEVEIVSVFRHKDRPFLPASDRVGLTHLVDLRPEADRWWRRGRRLRLATPSTLFHPQERAYGRFNAESDRAILRYLDDPKTDALITTRAGLNIAAARHAPAGLMRIGQEHLHFGAHKPGLLEEMRRWYRELDAVVTLTEADRRAYAGLLDGARTAVRSIGNGLPDRPRPRSDLDGRLVVAAGRLVPVKGYDRLLEAFAKVVAERPDWRLRVYGDGGQRDRLRRRAHDLGLDDSVAFMGPTGDMDGAMAEASLHVVTSRFEGFGMTIIEALAAGVPVVSFDCPQGPREILTSGTDGVLVPDGDVDAFADAMLALMDDPAEMRRLSDNGLETARRYRVSEVARLWEDVLTDLR